MSALEEYHEWARGYEWFSEQAQTAVALADAAIAEFENRLKAAEAMSADAWRQVRIARDRAEQAEAENERLTELADLIGIREDKLRAENERLRAQIQERDEFLADSWGDP